MESGLFLDVVVGKGSAVFQLFTGKDQTLLVWWDTFLVLQITILESGFYIFLEFSPNILAEKVFLFVKNENFGPKIFFVKNVNFCRKSIFLSKMKILAKKYFFYQK